MDTIKMLLAATTALLLGALAWTWQTQRNLTKDAPVTELARIQKQLEEIKREEAILRTEKQLRDMGVSSTPAANSNGIVQTSNQAMEEKPLACSKSNSATPLCKWSWN